MESQHGGHGGDVIDGHDTGHDSGRAKWDQAAYEAEQFIGADWCGDA